ncbi:acetylcholine receptor subunit alpha-like [Biomphalaria glabrata]|uniref:Acetylcholine receptor subunit alpha-like n=1 Tax=Biomphalaria glabrata TaxID=6526 RepID=A0A9W3B3Q1_BIOGL|nr:acetylcholine receptor subunit alpha-like [Biomphalaria glabrata]
MDIAASNIVVLVCLSVGQTSSQLYNHTRSILSEKLSKDVYHTEVRPKRNQSEVLEVNFKFYLESLVEVNDVSQDFIVNGFLAMAWYDELAVWDPKDYGGIELVHPLPEDIWRPRIGLMNTLGERDIFGDSKAPTNLFYNGYVYYVPGSVFHTSCEMTLVKFPFDVQNCSIEFVAMSQTADAVRFVPENETGVEMSLFIPHVEWDLISTYVKRTDVPNPPITYQTVNISFLLKRRPDFLLLNTILPVVFLSFLNIMVFIIPAESGEKIGFGITVLLALAVFLSMVSTMLPRSSKTMPKITIFLFLLLVISLLTVVDSIIIVYLHHLEEKEGKLLRAKNKYKSAANKIRSLTKAVTKPDCSQTKSQKNGDVSPVEVISSRLFETSLPVVINEHGTPGKNIDGSKPLKDNKNEHNKYRLIGKYIDFVSFIVFLIIWICVTIGFMLDITSVIHV